VQKTVDSLNERGKTIKGSKILILGVAYKKDVDDDRESPAYVIMDLLIKRGAEVSYNDPHIPYLKKSRKYNFGLTSQPVIEEFLKEVDAVIIVTDHSNYDYQKILKAADLIIDTRGVYKGDRDNEKVIKA
jgi:UDP-N-acetyl-D-glucosamine dehydrogenase